MLRLSLEKTALLKLLDNILIENESLIAWTSVDWLARPKHDKYFNRKKSSKKQASYSSNSKQYNIQEASWQEENPMKSSASLASLSQFSIDDILNVQTKPIFYGFIVLTEFRLICVKYNDSTVKDRMKRSMESLIDNNKNGFGNRDSSFFWK